MDTTYIRIKVVEGHNPKIDHNISVAGLLVTDANTVNKKLEREREGILKGLYVFRKKTSNGDIYICNGAEFPNTEAVDLLLYLIVKLEENNWSKKLSFKSVRKLLKEVFGVDTSKFWLNKLKRILIIWKNHSFYFPKNFIWNGELVEAYFGVIEDFEIKSYGRGKPSKVTIIFNEKFLEICRNTTWYRRPSWKEIRKLRKEIAKRLYMVALGYKTSESSKNWKIYIDNDLKEWYRNTFNSLANPKYLKPYYVINRLEEAIAEINDKTSLEMKLTKTEEGNYCINVKEKEKEKLENSGEAVRIIIPFDELKDEDKSLLINYVAKIADKKGIKNIWGFLRSLNPNQIEDWLKKAKEYFGIKDEKEEDTQEKENLKSLYVERPELMATLLEWGKRRFQSEATYRIYFGKGNIVGAYESEEEVLFICKDNVLARLIEKNRIDKELAGVFGKKVTFVGKDSVDVKKLINKQSG